MSTTASDRTQAGDHVKDQLSRQTELLARQAKALERISGRLGLVLALMLLWTLLGGSVVMIAR